MIIKLHGTSGSGKTTAARGIMALGTVEALYPLGGSRPSAYRVDIQDLKEPIYVLGPYEATCGGLDSISEADDHIILLTSFGGRGHVLYEGLLQSGFYGRIGAASEQFGDDHIFAFLDTPLETCIARVEERRAARGASTPFNPANTIDKYHAIQRLRQRLENGLKCPIRRTTMISHLNPVKELMEIYRASEQ